VALLYERSIPYFQQRFKPGKRYRISNAQVKPNTSTYNTTPNELCWTINTSTPVQEVDESIPPMLPHVHEFNSFALLHRNIDTDTNHS
jgi:hypothetical protein